MDKTLFCPYCHLAVGDHVFGVLNGKDITCYVYVTITEQVQVQWYKLSGAEA